MSKRNIALFIVISSMLATPMTLCAKAIPISIIAPTKLTTPMSNTEICNMITNYIKANGSSGNFKVVIEGKENDGLLVHAYFIVDNHTSTIGWYVINPATCKGYNSITNEQIDFLPYFHTTMSNTEIINTVANYIRAKGSSGNFKVVIEGKENDGLLVHAYFIVDNHTATIGWYVINPDTCKGYNFITDEQINFTPYFH